MGTRGQYLALSKARLDDFVLCVFQCKKCEEILPDAAQLRKHMRRAHTGSSPEKAFMCAECGQMFTRLGHLRRHTRLHTGDKPFMCNRCACQFARADHLRRHLQAHHADDPTLQPPLDPNFPADIKPDLDAVANDLPLIGVLGGNGPSDGGPAALNLPVFPGLGMEKPPDAGSHQGDVVDSVPASGDNLSGFSMLPGDRSGGPSETGTAESLPAFPGPAVDKSPTDRNQFNYQPIDILADLQSARLEAGKLAAGKDRHRTNITSGSVSYETARVASLPVFPGQVGEKTGTHYAAVEIPVELKNPQLDGRKSVTSDSCEQHPTTVVSRFQESGAASSATLSLPEHRNFPVSGNSAAFRADFWHRTSPAYMNDRLFFASAANLRHFDVEFPRSSETVPTNLAHRYSQSHPMMPGNFLGGVVDFRRLPQENPAVTSPQSDAGIPDASPLSLARYQRK